MKDRLFAVWRAVSPNGPIQWSIAIAVGVVFSAIGIMYQAGRYPVTSNEVTVVTPQVRAGEEFILRYDVVWNDTCQVTGYRFIIDGDGYTHERIVDSRTVIEGRDHFDIRITVPAAAAPGVGQYRGEVEYVCGFIQKLLPLRREITPREFEILPPSEDTNPMMSYGHAFQCPIERPVYVTAHCRSYPGQHTSHMDDAIEVDLGIN